MKKLVKLYFHRNKEDNFDLAEKLDITDKEAQNTVEYLGYEIEVLFEVDTDTGIGSVVGAEGLYLVNGESYKGDV